MRRISEECARGNPNQNRLDEKNLFAIKENRKI